MKRQIIFIHGGDTFGNKTDFYKFLKSFKVDPYAKKVQKWNDILAKNLGNNYEIFQPEMPIKYNADYTAWKIWFEKYLPFLKDKNPILIGRSLGATFLLKYLSENNFPKKISQLHLVAPAVFDDGLTYEKLSTFEFNIKNINKISKICKEIYLYHSKDDPIVSFKNSEMVKENLPNANFFTFKNRGHFRQEKFPEILKIIKSNKF